MSFPVTHTVFEGLARVRACGGEAKTHVKMDLGFTKARWPYTLFLLHS